MPPLGTHDGFELGPRHSVGYSVALASWCLQLADQLADELTQS